MTERCTKPGCGAQRRIGNPCTDWDCPQQHVSHSDYASLESELATLRAENEALRRRLANAEDERDEALQAPWPQWADAIRKCLMGYGVDPGDEWDLPEQFEDWLNGVVENETARATAAESTVEALVKALEEKREQIVAGPIAWGKDYIRGRWYGYVPEFRYNYHVSGNVWWWMPESGYRFPVEGGEEEAKADCQKHLNELVRSIVERGRAALSNHRSPK